MLHVSRSELGRAPVGGPNFLAAPHAGEPLTDRPLRTRPWRIRMRQGPLDAWLWFPQMAALLTVRARPPRRPSHVCSEHRPRLSFPLREMRLQNRQPATTANGTVLAAAAARVLVYT